MGDTISQKPKHRYRFELVKGAHKFVFKWNDGDEPLLYDHIENMVKRRDLPFDQFDAAVASHGIRTKRGD